MVLKNKQHIKTHLSLTKVESLLGSSKEFGGIIKKEIFKIKERSFFSNQLLFPEIHGILKEFNGNTDIFLSFKISILDKIALTFFLIIDAFLSIYFYIMSREILISLIVVLWSLFMILFFYCVYYRNCSRALKKLRKLFCSLI